MLRLTTTNSFSRMHLWPAPYRDARLTNQADTAVMHLSTGLQFTCQRPTPLGHCDGMLMIPPGDRALHAPFRVTQGPSQQERIIFLPTF
ncbi:hypothetical protein CDAR_603251 [Caerostris darwini]|uniref:Uncharacterized protein n=1 Tax=Caerostris darwini TaxID=1538125 RepID=A0AAV4PIK2_9ARAC|nr:hypothetical protein CDAR_603251 [Caerostris darwini]